jgi:hypothetical protein
MEGACRAKHLMRQGYGSLPSIRVTAIPVRQRVLRRGRAGQSPVHVASRVEDPKLSRDRHSGASCCLGSTFQRAPVRVTASPVCRLLSGRPFRPSVARPDQCLNPLSRHQLSCAGVATALSRDRNSRTSSDRRPGSTSPIRIGESTNSASNGEFRGGFRSPQGCRNAFRVTAIPVQSRCPNMLLLVRVTAIPAVGPARSTCWRKRGHLGGRFRIQTAASGFA